MDFPSVIFTTYKNVKSINISFTRYSIKHNCPLAGSVDIMHTKICNKYTVLVTLYNVNN